MMSRRRAEGKVSITLRSPYLVVPKSGERALLAHRRRGAGRALQADAVVPVGVEPDLAGADEVEARAGDEQHFLRIEVELPQRQAVRLGARLVEARAFGGDDDLERNAELRRRGAAEALGAVGDDAELVVLGQLAQDAGGLVPRLNVAPLFAQRRGVRSGKPGASRGLGNQRLVRPVDPAAVGQLQVGGTPAPAGRL